MPAFALQFAIEYVADYAARFPAAGDDDVLALGRAARDRGYYRRSELIRVCRWKTPRSGPLVRRNRAPSVEAATRAGLEEGNGERERAEALLSLRGVGWPTASVLLHVAFPDRYPILDVRALHALGVKAPSAYSFRFWEAYVTAWRPLAERSGVDGRTFDRALWQWSKEQATPPRVRPARPGSATRSRERTSRSRRGTGRAPR
jgi:hypothetical protein